MNDRGKRAVPPDVGVSRHLRRRREAEPTRLDLLLGEPGTVHAAHNAFRLAERPDAASWPFVASVGPETVALRWAGASVPEPTAPWRPGYDARVWIADRAELDAAAGTLHQSGTGGTAVLVGWFDDTVVFVNTSRAPGPIAVEGDEDGAALLHELITPQTPLQPRTSLDGSGAWWPMEVRGTAIQLLGLAVAKTFAAEQTRQAVELVRLAAALDVVRQSEAEAVQAGPRPVTRAADELDVWLRQVKEAAARARFEGARTRAKAAVAAASQEDARPAQIADIAPVAPSTIRVQANIVDPVDEYEPMMPSASSVFADEPSKFVDDEPMPSASSAFADTPVFAAMSVPASDPQPSDQGAEELDDWATGFAVSSAEETTRR